LTKPHFLPLYIIEGHLDTLGYRVVLVFISFPRKQGEYYKSLTGKVLGSIKGEGKRAVQAQSDKKQGEKMIEKFQSIGIIPMARRRLGSTREGSQTRKKLKPTDEVKDGRGSIKRKSNKEGGLK